MLAGKDITLAWIIINTCAEVLTRHVKTIQKIRQLNFRIQFERKPYTNKTTSEYNLKGSNHFEFRFSSWG